MTDVTDWLKHLTASCRVLGRPEEALRVLPDLGVDSPPITEVVLDSGVVHGFLAPFSRSLARPLSLTLEQLLKPLTKGGTGENVGSLDVSALTNDPLTRAIAACLCEGAPLGARNSSAVVLEVARQSSLALDGSLDELQSVASDAAARLRPVVGYLEKLEPPARGAALSSLAVSLAARISAAVSLASKLDPRVGPTRIMQALARNRAALVVPAGGLEIAADLPFLATVLGARADGPTISAVFVAVRSAIAGSLDNTESAAAQGLRDLARDRKDPQMLALDPLIAEYVLQALPNLTDARSLEKSGLPKGMAKALLKGEGVAAMVASYGEVAEGLRVWDLLSTLASRSLPIWQDGSRFRTPHGLIDAPGPWALAGPRGDGGVVTATAVVLRARGLNRAAADAAKKPESSLAMVGLRKLWLGLEQEARRNRGLLDPDSSPARAVFVDSEGANAFIEAARRSFSLPVRLPLSPLAGDIQLGGDVEVQIHAATGDLAVMWDGQQVRICGAAIEELCAGSGESGASSGKGAALEELFRGASQKAAAAAPAADPFSGARAAPRAPEPAATPKAPADPFASAGPGKPPADPFASAGPGKPPADPFASAGPSAPDPFASVGASDPFATASASAPESDPFAGVNPFTEASAPKPAADPFAAGADPFASPAPPERPAPKAAPPRPPPEPAPPPKPAPPPPKPAPRSAPDGGPSPDAKDRFDALMSRTESPAIRAAAEPAPVSAASLLRSAPDPFATPLREATPPRTAPQKPADDEPDPFAAVSSFTLKESGPSRAPAEADPFAASPALSVPGFGAEPRVTMTPQAVGWESGAPRPTPAQRPPAKSEIQESSGILSMEIEDSEEVEEEGANAVQGPELFFLPPPPTQAPVASDLDFTDLPDPFSDKPERPAAAPAADPFAAPAEPRRPAAPTLSAQDLAHMFQGYVVLRASPQVVMIGQRYGNKLVDAHEYPAGADDMGPYMAFAADKIRENFLPRTDLIRTPPAGAKLAPLDLTLVAKALSKLA